MHPLFFLLCEKNPFVCIRCKCSGPLPYRSSLANERISLYINYFRGRGSTSNPAWTKRKSKAAVITPGTFTTTASEITPLSRGGGGRPRYCGAPQQESASSHASGIRQRAAFSTCRALSRLADGEINPGAETANIRISTFWYRGCA